MNKKGIFGILAIFVLMLSSSAVYAFGPRFFESEDRELMNTALENEDFEDWQEIISEELTEENFERALKRHAHREEVKENMGKVKEAIEAEDYDAYIGAIQNCERMQEVSEEDFEILIEAYHAREDGDHDTAKELRESIGLVRFGQGKGIHQGRGMFHR